MKHEKLSEALHEVSDRYIVEAAKQKKKHPIRWVMPVAAVLAVVILAATVLRPPLAEQGTPEDILQNPSSDINENTPVTPYEPGSKIDTSIQLDYLLAKAEYPELYAYPLDNDDPGAYEKWWAQQREYNSQPEDYAVSLQDFWQQLSKQVMTDTDGKNITCSPVNIYMALAMLAETADGESRQQILDLLGASSLEALRAQAKHVWRANYSNDGLSTSIPASSLWLQEDLPYREDTVKRLAENYYASVFRGDMAELEPVLQNWLNEQTQGLLEEQTQNIKLDPMCDMVLATTLFYQVQWVNRFMPANNTEGIFHGAAGDTRETFMNRRLNGGTYYWSENFGAVSLGLEDNSRMWLILPDEGVTPEALLQSGEVADFLNARPSLYDSAYENKKSLNIDLSLPKFDISADLQLKDALIALGITDVFSQEKADFGGIIPDTCDAGYINDVHHAARVTIDEDGVTAAAFTVIDRCGATMPPEEEMDFILDRSFLFYIENQDGLPLFTGIVNEP